MGNATQEDKIFVGYTNGYQILYANEVGEGEGAFYSNTDNESWIPLYMLARHAHRLESTTNGEVTLDKVMAARKLKS